MTRNHDATDDRPMVPALVAAARREPAPAIDVRAAVLARLSLGAVPGERMPRRPMLIASALAVAAAVALGSAAMHAWSAWTNPVLDLFSPFTMVMQ